MAASGVQAAVDRQGDHPPSGSPSTSPPSRPWRAEGLPKGGHPPTPRRRWQTAAVWLVGYLILLGVLTLQDRLSGAQPVPYTDFKTQVANKNVGELFARGNSIEGQLKKAAPLPGQPH